MKSKRYNFKLFDFGYGIHSCKLKKFYKKKGDKVKINDPLVKIKVLGKIELPLISKHKGVIEKIYFFIGDTVNVGEVILTLNITEKD